MPKSATAASMKPRRPESIQLPQQRLGPAAIDPRIAVGGQQIGGMQLGKGPSSFVPVAGSLGSQPFVSTPIKRKISLRTPAGKRNTVTVTFTHKTDPKQDILSRIGDLPEGLVQFSRVLVAVYQPPIVEKTDAGLYLTPIMQQEDLEEFLWQGKVGLIVAMGAQAYVDDETTKFHGVANKVGDWVWFNPSEGRACEVNGVFCRVFSESGIMGPVPHPDYVW